MLPQKLNRDGTVKERPLATITPGSDLPTVPEIMDIDDVIDGLDSENEFVRDTCRDFLGKWITPVSPDVEQKQRMSRMMRQKYVDERRKANERDQRYHERKRGGKPKRKYHKRKR